GRRLAPRVIEVYPAELNAGARGCELPIGFAVICIAISLPCGDFAVHGLFVRKPSFCESPPSLACRVQTASDSMNVRYLVPAPDVCLNYYTVSKQTIPRCQHKRFHRRTPLGGVTQTRPPAPRTRTQFEVPAQTSWFLG